MVLVVARETALECCSSSAFADRLAARGSYADIEEIVAAAREIWWNQVGTVARHGMSGMWQHLCLCRGLPEAQTRLVGRHSTGTQPRKGLLAPPARAADASGGLAGGICGAPHDRRR